MPLAVDPQIDHLMRRAGFGARADDLALFQKYSTTQAVEYLIAYDDIPDDVDSHIGQAGYLGTTSNGPFSPNTVIDDARQRLRFGGIEPTLFPELAMELSVWYEGEFRTDAGTYGYSANPYEVEQQDRKSVV